MDVRLFPILFAISFFNLEEDSPSYQSFKPADIEIIKKVKVWSIQKCPSILQYDQHKTDRNKSTKMQLKIREIAIPANQNIATF